jgi:mRNA interferase RelE/StbE
MIKVLYTERAVKQLLKLDRSAAIMIKKWMNKNIDGCEDPFAHGKALTSNKKGLWRYCVGDYRVICKISAEELIVLAIDIGHRSSIYK